MAKIIATVVDAADSMMRKLGGQRLCQHCQQWAKKPYAKGGLHFCDHIHASIYFRRQEEQMRQALEKEKSAPKTRSGRPTADQ